MVVLNMTNTNVKKNGITYMVTIIYYQMYVIFSQEYYDDII